MVSINFEAGLGTNEKVGGGTITVKPKDILICWSRDHNQPIGSSIEEPIYNLQFTLFTSRNYFLSLWCFQLTCTEQKECRDALVLWE